MKSLKTVGHAFGKILSLCLILSCMFASQSFANGSSSSAFQFQIIAKSSGLGIGSVEVTIVSGLEQFKTVTFLNTYAITSSRGKVKFNYNAQLTSTESHMVKVHLKLKGGNEETMEFPFTINNGKTTNVKIRTDNLESEEVKTLHLRSMQDPPL